MHEKLTCPTFDWYIENVPKIMIKNLFILLVSASCLFSCTQAKEKTSVKKPNIVLIMADDMGYECVSAYGSQEYNTPRLDKMAAEGVKFNHAYSQPLCTPTRVKIMTGKSNVRNYEYFGYLNPNQKTFGNLLQDAGYKTLIAGKWQLNGIYHDLRGNQDKSRPQHFGFDEYCLWQLTRNKQFGERFADPFIEQNGKEMRLNGDYGPDVFRNYIMNFIERNQDSSFFVYYPMVLVHDPFVPTPDSKAWQDSSRRYEKDTAYFADMVAYTDKIVGQLIDKLDELSLLENTLVIFTGDNGTHPSIYTTMADGGVFRGGKGNTIDAGNHVPFIAYWKGKAIGGKEIDDMIDFSDVLPTLLDAGNVPLQNFVTDGKSFLPALTDTSFQGNTYVYQHYNPRWGRWKEDSLHYIFNQEYKLYLNGQFYHTSQDSRENNPLTDQKLSGDEKAKKVALSKALQKNIEIVTNKKTTL